jgi:excisionase family DNA binding protein
MNTQNQVPRWLTIPMAAVYSSSSVKFIRTLLWKRELQYTKAGKRFIIDRDDLDRWMASNKVTA